MPARSTFYRADLDDETGDPVIHRMRRVNCPEGYCETEEQARVELEKRLVAAANHGCCESTVTHEDEIAVPHIDTIAANDDESGTPNEEEPDEDPADKTDSGTTNEKGKVDNIGTTNEECKVRECPACIPVGSEARTVFFALEVMSLRLLERSALSGLEKDGYIPLQVIALQARMTRAKARVQLDKLTKMGVAQRHPTQGCFRVVALP